MVWPVIGAIVGGVMANQRAKQDRAAQQKAIDAQMAGFRQYEPYVDATLEGSQEALNNVLDQGVYQGQTYAGPSPEYSALLNNQLSTGGSLADMGSQLLANNAGFGSNANMLFNQAFNNAGQIGGYQGVFDQNIANQNALAGNYGALANAANQGFGTYQNTFDQNAAQLANIANRQGGYENQYNAYANNIANNANQVGSSRGAILNNADRIGNLAGLSQGIGLGFAGLGGRIGNYGNQVANLSSNFGQSADQLSNLSNRAGAYEGAFSGLGNQFGNLAAQSGQVGAAGAANIGSVGNQFQNLANMAGADRLGQASAYAQSAASPLVDSILRDERQALGLRRAAGNQAASGSGNTNSSRAGVAEALDEQCLFGPSCGCDGQCARSITQPSTKPI